MTGRPGPTPRRSIAALLTLLVLTTGAGCSDDGSEFPAAQARMEEEMQALLAELAPDAEIDVAAHSGDPSPCGGIEGSSWSEVLASYAASVPDPPSPETLLPRAQEALDTMGVEHTAGTGRAFLGVRGQGYVASLRHDEEGNRLLVAAETDCLDNPEE